MLNLIKKATVVNSAGNAYVFDNIMAGVGGSATIGYSLNPLALQVDDNQRQQYCFEHQLDIRVLDADSNYAYLQNDIASGEKFDVSLLTLDGFVFMEDVLLSAPRQMDQVLADQIFVTKKTVPTYHGPTFYSNAGVYGGDNLLAFYDVENGDATRIHGFTSTVNSLATTYAGGAMNCVAGANNGYAYFEPMAMPFAGEQFQATIEVKSVAGAGVAQLGVAHRKTKGGGITHANAGPTITTAGNYTVTFGKPSDALYTSFFVRVIASGDWVNVANPRLRKIGTGFTM